MVCRGAPRGAWVVCPAWARFALATDCRRLRRFGQRVDVATNNRGRGRAPLAAIPRNISNGGRAGASRLGRRIAGMGGPGVLPSSRPTARGSATHRCRPRRPRARRPKRAGQPSRPGALLGVGRALLRSRPLVADHRGQHPPPVGEAARVSGRSGLDGSRPVVLGGGRANCLPQPESAERESGADGLGVGSLRCAATAMRSLPVGAPLCRLGRRRSKRTAPKARKDNASAAA